MANLAGLRAFGLALLALTAPALAAEERMTLAVPQRGAYTGAYVEFGENEDHVTLEAIEGFSSLVGKHQAIVAFSSFWGRGQFPSAQARIVHNAGAVPLILWYPWDSDADRERSRFDLQRILAGAWDGYIDRWAQGARAYGKPLLLSWGLEMNGDWFPWCGVLQGGGTPVPDTDPVRYQGPETYKRAYRYLVERVRAAGADNIQWVFHVNNTPAPPHSWNRMAAYYPGPDYVDWLGMSAYGQQFGEEDWFSVEDMVMGPYAELAAVDPNKPIILAEWGVGEFPKQGSKGDWIKELFARAPRDLPRLKAAVFWHERWQNADLTYSNLRVNSSLEALTAYRAGVANPFWVDQPLYLPPNPAATSLAARLPGTPGSASSAAGRGIN